MFCKVSDVHIFVSDHKTHSGFFTGEFNTELEVFCPWIGGDLQVFDVNHDGYDDLICHTSTVIIQISESHIVGQRTGRNSVEQTMESGDNVESTTAGVDETKQPRRDWLVA